MVRQLLAGSHAGHNMSVGIVVPEPVPHRGGHSASGFPALIVTVLEYILVGYSVQFDSQE